MPRLDFATMTLQPSRRAEEHFAAELDRIDEETHRKREQREVEAEALAHVRARYREQADPIMIGGVRVDGRGRIVVD
jgi:hypothetical protein